PLATPHAAPGPPAYVPPAAPLPRGGRPPPPGHGTAHRRRPGRQKNSLVGARSSGAGGWVGCLVILVFFGAVTFNLVQSLVAAIIDALR
ncbi:MAG TPA: hypothetical protein VGD67_27120, partial [Pseudonocardiaceae bacterium]